MTSIASKFSAIATLCIAILISAVTPCVAWAQKADEAADTGKSYTLGYALVALGVGLGLMLVLRPVGRTTEIKLPKSA